MMGVVSGIFWSSDTINGYDCQKIAKSLGSAHPEHNDGCALKWIRFMATRYVYALVIKRLSTHCTWMRFCLLISQQKYY